MDFNEYQEHAKSTAIYPDFDSGSDLELSYLALGLNGEAGEVAEKIKKLIRDGIDKWDINTVTLFNESVVRELGDVLWYVALMANALGVSLEGVASANVFKLQARQERGVLGGNGDNR